MIRRTKIVATLGPACNNPKILERMIQAGVDVVRVNFSHGTREQHIEFVELTRSLARAAGRTVGVLICKVQKYALASLSTARSGLK